MRRRKVQCEQEISRLTAGNAEWTLGRFLKRSCRGAVELSFDIVPGLDIRAISTDVIDASLRDDTGYPEMLTIHTKGRIVGDGIVGMSLDIYQDGCREEVRVPFELISPIIMVRWHEWEERLRP